MNRASHTYCILLLAFLAGLLVATRVNAQTLDASFGNAGIVELDENVMDRLQTMKVGSDGSIYVLGSTWAGITGQWNLLLAKYNSNGTPNMLFGGDGAIQIDSGREDGPYDLAIQDDGKVVVLFAAGGKGPTLIRYHALGYVDDTFGALNSTVGGSVTIDSELPPRPGNGGGQTEIAFIPRNVEIINDKIVIAGREKIARFDLNGSVDPSFGQNGVAWLADTLAETMHVSQMQSNDGRIFLYGKFHDGVGNYSDPRVVALTENGLLDSNVGDNGVVAPPNGTLISEPDRFTVHNGLITASSRNRVIRMDFDGMLDSNFSIDGVAEFEPAELVNDVILQPNGLVTAAVVMPDLNRDELAVVRLTKDGRLDDTFKHTTFGLPDDGWYRFSLGERTTAHRMFSYANGKLLIAADYTKYTGNENIVLMRLKTFGSGKPGIPFGGRQPNQLKR